MCIVVFQIQSHAPKSIATKFSIGAQLILREVLVQLSFGITGIFYMFPITSGPVPTQRCPSLRLGPNLVPMPERSLGT